MFILTNNPMIKEKITNINIEFVAEGYIDILNKARDYVHKGYKILNHPLYGSIKPNETIYRTIIMEEDNKLDDMSLILIEDAISTAVKFVNNRKTPAWIPSVLEDFMVIDLDIIEDTIKRIFY